VTLYVVRYHPALSETFVRDELSALHEAGEPVALAAFDPRDGFVGETLRFPVYAQPHRWGWLGALPALLREWLRAPAFVSLRVLWLATLVRGATHVHVHFAGEAAEWTRAACARVGRRYSVTAHAVDLYKPRPALGDVLRDAVAVVVFTEYNRALVAERFGLVARRFRFGLALDRIATAAPDASRRLLSVGRNVPKKGLDLVLGLADRLGDEAEVVVVSDLPPRGPARVLGLLAHPEVLALHATAGLFVLPCRQAPDGDMDGLPVALVEAMAAGVPVVTTPVSGVPELVDEEVGWLVPPDDLDALERAVRAALTDPAERARRGAAARARVQAQGFDRARLAAALRSLFGELRGG
jgi:glycosyltransferase involved in cell wall biosynthesis